MFGYLSFNEGQLSIIENILDQQNTLGLLPTGGGKSLCFQLPSLLQLGCSIVVCPIIALMNDHVHELKSYGFNNRCEFIYGEQPRNKKILFLIKLEEVKLNFYSFHQKDFKMKNFVN